MEYYCKVQWSNANKSRTRLNTLITDNGTYCRRPTHALHCSSDVGWVVHAGNKTLPHNGHDRNAFRIYSCIDDNCWVDIRTLYRGYRLTSSEQVSVMSGANVFIHLLRSWLGHRRRRWSWCQLPCTTDKTKCTARRYLIWTINTNN